jgi:Holliday junction resolvase RusA-like endonuclease
MIEASKRLKPWRETVRIAALAMMRELNEPLPLDGPLICAMVFTMPRPKTVTRDLPDRVPDLSKLCRAVEDSMTDARVWVDDARVVGYVRLQKLYEGSPGALGGPGVSVAVWTAAEAARADVARLARSDAGNVLAGAHYGTGRDFACLP